MDKSLTLVVIVAAIASMGMANVFDRE